MQKAKVYNIADSNIANLGTELEKKVKLAAAQTEEAWKNAGKTPGLEIWRINQFKVTSVPKNAYGTVALLFFPHSFMGSDVFSL